MGQMATGTSTLEFSLLSASFPGDERHLPGLILLSFVLCISHSATQTVSCK